MKMRPGLFALGLFLAAILSNAHAAPPNILVIIADDLGYADVGFTGGREIKTPNLDKLAQSGAVLDQYYVQPVCSPTRAALLTGRYPMRYGLQTGVLRPYESRGLPLEERLLPQALKEAGYTTAIVGKWHLGHYRPEYLPTRRGFDHQYGHYCGQIDYYTHLRDGGFDWHRDDKRCDDEGYSTHLVAKEAVRLIHAQPANKPFFLYVPFNAVHSPYHVPEEYTKAYQSLPERRRIYAGMIAAMDEAVGKISAALDARGLRTNTLILFSSDNGGPAPGKVTDNGSLRSGKGSLYEGGVRVCAFVAWEGKIKSDSRITAPLHAVDWYPTLLKLAYNQANQANQDNKDGSRATRATASLDGMDIWPALSKGQALPDREILINTTPNTGAIRVGNWKLVLHEGPPGEGDDSDNDPLPARKRARASQSPRIELFDLAADPGEKNDLSAQQPARVAELRKRYDSYARQAAPPSNRERPPGFKSPAVWGETAKAE